MAAEGSGLGEVYMGIWEELKKVYSQNGKVPEKKLGGKNG